MKNRMLGCVFFIIAAYFFVNRYIVAAICLSATGGWDGEVFENTLNETGGNLFFLSILFLLLGIVFICMKENKSEQRKDIH